MELVQSSATDMAMEPVIFRWPMGEGEEPFPVQAIQLLQRPNGLLMAFPSEAISDAMLDAWSEPMVPGGEPLVGARARIYVPTFFAVAAPERSVEVLVVDMASPPAETMILPFSEDQPDYPFATTFLEEGTLSPMNMDSLMFQVREWLSQELGDRMAFYSAQEEEEPAETPAAPARRRSALRSPGQNLPGGNTTDATGAPSSSPKAPVPKKPTDLN